VTDADGAPLAPEWLPGRRVVLGDTPEPLLMRGVVRARGEVRWYLLKATPLHDAETRGDAGGERPRERHGGARGGAARALPHGGRRGARRPARLRGDAAARGAARRVGPGGLVRDRAPGRARGAAAGRARPRRLGDAGERQGGALAPLARSGHARGLVPGAAGGPLAAVRGRGGRHAGGGRAGRRAPRARPAARHRHGDDRSDADRRSDAGRDDVRAGTRPALHGALRRGPHAAGEPAPGAAPSAPRLARGGGLPRRAGGRRGRLRLLRRLPRRGRLDGHPRRRDGQGGQRGGAHLARSAHGQDRRGLRSPPVRGARARQPRAAPAAAPWRP
jgi:hypothetical protein